MRILSLFDGIGTGRLILDQLNTPVDAYYASEIDNKAIDVSSRHYPDIIQLGDVNKIDFNRLGKIDLLLGGSPCQDVSFAGKRVGLEGARSGLYTKYVEALTALKPTYFLLENTKMKQEYIDTISTDLGVKPVELDAAKFSATSRKRLYWFNFDLSRPLPSATKNLIDVLEPERDVDIKCVVIPKRPVIQLPTGKRKWGYIGNDAQANRIYNPEFKSVCLTSLSGGLGAKTGLYKVGNTIRMLTPLEAERVMGLPDGYTDGFSRNERYKMIGNGWSVETVKYILSHVV